MKKPVTLSISATTLVGVFLSQSAGAAVSYPVVDTGQASCYSDTAATTCPLKSKTFYGQDAQTIRNAPSYTNNANGTVTDKVTGLMWQQSPDTTNDGQIKASDKLAFSRAQTYCQDLVLGGYSDWRLPDIKTLYSLIDFRGTDPSGAGNSSAGQTPFINTSYFKFGYGDTSAGERIIDAQYWSNTQYVSTTMVGDATVFGVNFADGRIKGYPRDKSPFGAPAQYVRCVRGNTAYGANSFTNNRNGTVTDAATGLMWAQADSAKGMNWKDALAWVAQMNTAKYLGYSDWRLPNTKELQSIVDYTRSPNTTGSAAINPVFSVTGIINEAGQTDAPTYWSSTTHASKTSGVYAAYVAFGRAMGYMNGIWLDVHGAGAQRSDPKSGSPSSYPTGHGPQGDAIRIYNYVRLVRQ
ncbi:MAG: DUF1566 domain-containing protein [Thiothrix sp.]|uniref:Lcl C-terminal domain-containing protein n=1 Tax=Thiothrix sp. TaxID=1032 RepID=UPI002617C26B|nr:DUF1566 domain-containing protein [Thiothrix sp.]MDD5391532.1 DUF1566 domain-containing protein [Thiothrix sp.]